jgi:hypothetical protein
MGAKSGSAISSIPSSGFALSNASDSNSFDKSRRGTSSSKSSNHFSEQEKKEIEGERNKLLNDTISEIEIGIEPIGKELGHKISYYGRYLGRALLPTYLGGASIIHHLSCLITLRDTKEKVILEYGAYHGGETGYNNYIHYIYKEEGGLRFSRMGSFSYDSKIHNGKEGSEIITRLSFDNQMTLNDLIYECCKGTSWKAKDYNLASHNCQDFIAKVIEKLKVKRDIYDDTLYCHKVGKIMYPPVILRALEKNDTPLGLRIADKIPFIGLFSSLGGMAYKSIKYNA